MTQDRNHISWIERNRRDESADSAGSAASSPHGRWTGRLAILAALLITLGPVLYFGLPSEIASWHVAAGTEKWLDGKKQEAFAQLDAALRWARDDAAIYVCRADWRLEDGQFEEALEDYDRALALESDHLWARIQRCEVFQHLERHAEAVRDWKKLADQHQSASAEQRAVFLNGLAYAQSLDTGKKPELDKALENITQALNLVGQNAAMLDTRGFIHYRRGNLAAAIVDLNPAVQQMEQQHKEMEQTRQYLDRREFERQLQKSRKSLAVIRYHRALVFDALGMSKEAEADRQRVRELGFVPGPSLF